MLYEKDRKVELDLKNAIFLEDTFYEDYYKSIVSVNEMETINELLSGLFEGNRDIAYVKETGSYNNGTINKKLFLVDVIVGYDLSKQKYCETNEAPSLIFHNILKSLFESNNKINKNYYLDYDPILKNIYDYESKNVIKLQIKLYINYLHLF